MEIKFDKVELTLQKSFSYANTTYLVMVLNPHFENGGVSEESNKQSSKFGILLLSEDSTKKLNNM